MWISRVYFSGFSGEKWHMTKSAKEPKRCESSHKRCWGGVGGGGDWHSGGKTGDNVRPIDLEGPPPFKPLLQALGPGDMRAKLKTEDQAMMTVVVGSFFTSCTERSRSRAKRSILEALGTRAQLHRIYLTEKRGPGSHLELACLF